jgi:hypothetical protein
METTNAIEPARSSMLRRAIAVLIFCSAILSGCTQDVAKRLEQEARWSVVVYEHGREQPSRTIRRDSPEGAELIK